MFTFLLSSVNLTSVWRIFNNKFKIPIWRRFEISGFSLKVSHLKLVGKPGSCPKLGTDMFFCVSVWNMNLLCQLNFGFYLRFMFYFCFLSPFFFSLTKTSQEISSFTFIKDNFCFSMLFDTFNLPHFSILKFFTFLFLFWNLGKRGVARKQFMSPNSWQKCQLWSILIWVTLNLNFDARMDADGLV